MSVSGFIEQLGESVELEPVTRYYQHRKLAPEHGPAVLRERAAGAIGARHLHLFAQALEHALALNLLEAQDIGLQPAVNLHEPRQNLRHRAAWPVGRVRAALKPERVVGHDPQPIHTRSVRGKRRPGKPSDAGQTTPAHSGACARRRDRVTSRAARAGRGPRPADAHASGALNRTTR